MPSKRLEGPALVIAGPFGVPQTNTTFDAAEIPAGTFIPPYGVSVIVTTLLDGGTPSIDVGDSADADIWVDTTDITETSAGTYTGDGGDAAQAVSGKYYASASKIRCTLATGLTAGVFYIAIRMYDVSGAI